MNGGLPITAETTSLCVTFDLGVIHVFSDRWFVPVGCEPMRWLNEVHLLLGAHVGFQWILAGEVGWRYECHTVLQTFLGEDDKW